MEAHQCAVFSNLRFGPDFFLRMCSSHNASDHDSHACKKQLKIAHFSGLRSLNFLESQ
jgi:hypothetical protein